jgi:hypothetical protein
MKGNDMNETMTTNENENEMWVRCQRISNSNRLGLVDEFPEFAHVWSTVRGCFMDDGSDPVPTPADLTGGGWTMVEAKLVTVTAGRVFITQVPMYRQGDVAYVTWTKWQEAAL